MPDFNQDDIKALDMLASGKLDDKTSQAIKGKLGVDDEDVKAWGISANQPPKLKNQLRTEVIDKVYRGKSDITAIPGGVKATFMGAAQGATFGFSDEIIAGAKSAYEKIAKGGDLGKIYESKVKKERQELKELESKYPLQFIAGEIAGAVAVPIPGATGSRIALKGAKLVGEAALTSAGKAEGEFGSAQFLKEVAKGTAVGAGSGALLGKGFKKTAELIAKGDKPVRKSAQAIANILFDLPPSYTDKLLNPKTAQKILNPKSSEEIVDAVVDMTKQMGDHVKALSLKASEKLNNKKTLPINNILKEINNIPSVSNLARSGLPEAKAAKAAIANISEDLTLRSKKFMSERQLKQFIQDLDKEIPWDKTQWKLRESVIADIRSTLDHKILKKNLDYKEAMVPVDEIARNLKAISKSFSLKRDGFKLSPTDTTYSKVKNFFDVSGATKKPVTEEALKKAEDRFLGPLKPSILEDIELSQIARRTEAGQAAGSRNVLQGLAVGSLTGFPVVGAVVGAVKDKYGRKIGKSILPSTSESISKIDEGISKAMSLIPQQKIESILTTIGRVKGSQSGVESVNKPILMP